MSVRRRKGDIEITGYIEKPGPEAPQDEAMESIFVLNPEDPFEAALIDIATMNRKKRRDYALDGDIFSNFSATSRWAGFRYAWESALFNCAQKLERIKSLRENGRMDNPENESVFDTVLDNAVYGVIALADMKRERAEAAQRSMNDLLWRNYAVPSAVLQTDGPVEYKDVEPSSTASNHEFFSKD